ncbi:E3 ubiquitin-protein ligase, HECT-domain, putative [Ichthyophthirius multifiliis]|uniref:HECT-type E3 ubiquitin transferase n=1 Tax=Ichthyophthirius multifiliis TaxID=5932 RepID=G0QKA0_ICHMU|nr:E3 ubiquitin-protein ligase, HECT-domain, putative [Ichthyophthirius multifiliis]EGR34353.1 E3 ubiquitin-protein ligase, HECT-domain, putative [Ichthyophthirius multifiliis]|eukprot:XP_004039657.1 E3 ubiquitin-protein ligase, HECT-domain, putative [Ichthyophthirius multifiliis]
MTHEIEITDLWLQFFDQVVKNAYMHSDIVLILKIFGAFSNESEQEIDKQSSLSCLIKYFFFIENLKQNIDGIENCNNAYFIPISSSEYLSSGSLILKSIIQTLEKEQITIEYSEQNVRTRSSHIFKVIHHYIKFVKTSCKKQILVQKKIFSIFFMKQLEKHFQNFLPDWQLDTHGGYVLVQKLYNDYLQDFNYSNLEEHLIQYNGKMDDPIINACTLAMITNLLCRLIQDDDNIDPNLDKGMKYVFGQSWVSCKNFLMYISKIMEKTQVRKITQDESNTLDYDPFRYSMMIMENLLNYSADKTLKKSLKQEEIFTVENWNELFFICAQIIKNYLQMENLDNSQNQLRILLVILIVYEKDDQIIGSNEIFKNYLIEKYEDKLNEIINQKQEEFLHNDISVLELEDIILNYYSIIFSGSYFDQCNISKDEENYIKNNSLKNLSQCYLEKRLQKIKDMFFYFIQIIKKCSKNNSLLNILTAINFYLILNQIYKNIIKISYMLYTGNFYGKNNKKLSDIKNSHNKYIQNLLKEKNLENLIQKCVEKNQQENTKFFNEKKTSNTSFFSDIKNDFLQQNKTSQQQNEQNTQNSHSQNTNLKKNSKETFSKYFIQRKSWSNTIYGSVQKLNSQDYILHMIQSGKLKGEIPSLYYQESSEWMLNYMCEDNDCDSFYSQYIYDQENGDKWPNKNNNIPKAQFIYQQIIYDIQKMQTEQKNLQKNQQQQETKQENSQKNNFLQKQIEKKNCEQEENKSQQEILKLQQLIKLNSERIYLQNQINEEIYEEDEEEEKKNNSNIRYLQQYKNENGEDEFDEEKKHNKITEENQIILNFNNNDGYDQILEEDDEDDNNLDEENKNQFRQASVDEKINILKAAQYQFQQITQQQQYFLQENTLSEPEQKFDFQAYGFSENCLEEYQIDRLYFYSLSDEIKVAFLNSFRQENTEKANQQALSREEMQKVKLDLIIQREKISIKNLFNGLQITSHYRKSELQQIITFFNKFDSETRNFLLKFADNNLIERLPKDLRKNALKLRQKYSQTSQNTSQNNLNQHYMNSKNQRRYAFLYQSIYIPSIDDLSELDSDQQQESESENNNKNSYKKSGNTQDLDQIQQNFNSIQVFQQYPNQENNLPLDFFFQLPIIEDEILEILIQSLLISPSKEINNDDFQTFTESPLKLLQYLSLNPYLGYKIADSLTFLLCLNSKNYQVLDKNFSCFFNSSQISKSLMQSRICSIIRRILNSNICIQLYIQGIINPHKQLKIVSQDNIFIQIFDKNLLERNLNSLSSLELIQKMRQKIAVNQNLTVFNSFQENSSVLELGIKLIGEQLQGKNTNDFALLIVDHILSKSQFHQSEKFLSSKNQEEKIEENNLRSRKFSHEPQYQSKLNKNNNINDENNEFLNYDQKYLQNKQRKIQKKSQKAGTFYNVQQEQQTNNKYIIGEQIINQSFMKTLSEVIFKSAKRIKTNKNLLGIIQSLIKFKSINFVIILSGVLTHYGKQLDEIMQKIQANTENFKSTFLVKNNFNIKQTIVSQLKDVDQLNVILSKFQAFTLNSISCQEFKNLSHNLRHFIKDMKSIFEENILDQAIKLYTNKDIGAKQKEINKLKKYVQTLNTCSFQSPLKKQVMQNLEINQKKSKNSLINSLKTMISEKQNELKIWYINEKQNIHQRFTKYLKKKIYSIRFVNLAFRESIEYIFNLVELIGTDFNQSQTITLDIYSNWKYQIKSLIIFHQFMNPYYQNTQQQQNNTNSALISSSQLQSDEKCTFSEKKIQKYSLEDNFSEISSPEQNYNMTSPDVIKELNEEEQQEQEPKLSRLYSNEETVPQYLPISMLFRSTSAYNEPIFDIDQTFHMLYVPKIMQVIEQIMELNPERISNFHHFIRNTEKKDKLPLKIKLDFLRSIAKNCALQKQQNLQGETQSIVFVIDREKPWISTLEYLGKYTPAELVLKQIKIQFKEEDGIDYGGLTKEWLALLGKEVFNPDYGLFQLSANKRSIQPSHLSHIVPDHLTHFVFLGRLVGKSLVDKWHFDVNFCKSFLKHMLKKNVYIKDLEDIDPELSRNLSWMLENEIDDLMYDFSYTENLFGIQKTFELVKNGLNVPVNETNKKQFVKLFCEAKMIANIEKQAKAFIKGLESIIPREALEFINEQELGLHLTGMPTVDIEDMKKNTQYYYYTENHKVIKWFWEVLQEEDEIQRANFLFFLTGSFKVPYGGFKNYPLKIDRHTNADSLLVAHTCFNQIDLPEYDSKEKLKEKLIFSISEGSEGFHIG